MSEAFAADPPSTIEQPSQQRHRDGCHLGIVEIQLGAATRSGPMSMPTGSSAISRMKVRNPIGSNTRSGSPAVPRLPASALTDAVRSLADSPQAELMPWHADGGCRRRRFNRSRR